MDIDDKHTLSDSSDDSFMEQLYLRHQIILSGKSPEGCLAEDKIYHMSSQEESDTEDETDTNESEDNNDIDNNDWLDAKRTTLSVTPFTKYNCAVQPQANQVQDFYFLLITEDIFQMVVNETNVYATQVMTNINSDRLSKWKPTDRNEMKRFFGLLIWMGLVKLPNISSYWCKNNTYFQTFPKTVMSRNRFELLLRFLHFSNLQAEDKNDILCKISKVVDVLSQNFSKYYELDENICIDESLVPFRGRKIFQRCLKDKRDRHGIKLFKLCSGPGYTYKLHIHSKKLSVPRVKPIDIVMTLCKDILHKGHTIYIHNTFASVNLAQQLLACNTHLVGTVWKNHREIPRKIKSAKLKLGELIAMQNSKGVMILKWKDKRDVFMLSTKHSAETVNICKKSNMREKPIVVMDYNAKKCSVDIFNQEISYAPPFSKTTKWYTRLACEILLNTAVTNALLLYRKGKDTKISMSDFRMALAMHLTQCKDENVETPAPSNISVRKKLRHEFQKKEGSAHLVRKFCKVCYQKNVEVHGSKNAKCWTKKVTTYCEACDGQPHLCLKCFNTIHRTTFL